MRQNKVTTFVFVFQVFTAGTPSTSFGAASSVRKRRQSATKAPTEGRVEEMGAEEGSTTPTYTSQLAHKPNATSTKAGDVPCLYTLTVTIMKVEFTYENGTRIPGCDPDNQSNASPPYLEIKDVYNRTTRFCYVNSNHTIISFGDELQGRLVTTGVIDDIIPIIEIEQTKSPHCCGGVFYTKFGDKLATQDHYATSPKYPLKYSSNMRCPYIFRCIPVAPATKCTIQVDFIDFKLDSKNGQAAQQLLSLQNRHRREARNSTSVVSDSTPPPNQGFNKCKDGDFVRVASCGTITGRDSQLFCSERTPIRSFTSDSEVLLYFQSDEAVQDSGFVVSYVSLDMQHGSYSEAELNSSCRCGTSIPRMIRTQAERLNIANPEGKVVKRVRRQRRRYIRDRREIDDGDTSRERVVLKRERKEATSTRNKGTKTDRRPLKKQYGGIKVTRTSKKKVSKPAKGGKQKKDIRKRKKDGQLKSIKSKKRGDKIRRRKKTAKGDRMSKTKVIKNKKKNSNVDDREVAVGGQTKISNGNKIKDEEDTRFIVTLFQRPLNLIKRKKSTRSVKGSAQNPTKEDEGLLHRVKRQESTDKEKKKKKNKFVVSRQCTATVVNERFVLTSTSCCTYCGYVWNKKYRKKQSTTHSEHFARRKREAPVGGNKGNTKKPSAEKDQRPSKFGPKRKKQKASVKTSSGKINSKPKKKTNSKKIKPSNDKKANTKLRDKKTVVKQSGSSEANQSKKDKKKKRDKKKEQKKKDRKRYKFRSPKKTDIYISVGLYKVKPNKLKTYKIVKPKEIFIPEECYTQMSVKVIDGIDAYPMDCLVLIELGKPMTLGDRVKPICLPAFDTFDMTKQTAGLVGYGKKSLDSKKMVVSPKILTGIKMMDPSECQKKLGKQLHEDMFCTRAAPSGSACKGDEGGPLLLYKSTESGHKEHLNVFAVLVATGCTEKKKKTNIKLLSRSKRDNSADDNKKITKKKKKTKAGKGGKRNEKGVDSKRSEKKSLIKKDTNKDNGNSGKKGGKKLKGKKDKKSQRNGDIGKKKKKKDGKKGGKKLKGKKDKRQRKGDNDKKKNGKDGKRKEKKDKQKEDSQKQKTHPTKKGKKEQLKKLKSTGKKKENKKGKKQEKKRKHNKSSRNDQLVLTVYPDLEIAQYTRQSKAKKKKDNKKQSKKYNKPYSNGQNIDTWTRIGPSMAWILKIVFEGDDDLLCQRPLDFESSLSNTNETIVEACHAPPDREGGTA